MPAPRPRTRGEPLVFSWRQLCLRAVLAVLALVLFAVALSVMAGPGFAGEPLATAYAGPAPADARTHRSAAH